MFLQSANGGILLRKCPRLHIEFAILVKKCLQPHIKSVILVKKFHLPSVKISGVRVETFMLFQN